MTSCTGSSDKAISMWEKERRLCEKVIEPSHQGTQQQQCNGGRVKAHQTTEIAPEACSEKISTIIVSCSSFTTIVCYNHTERSLQPVYPLRQQSPRPQKCQMIVDSLQRSQHHRVPDFQHPSQPRCHLLILDIQYHRYIDRSWRSE